jgi:hypothetical protein
MACFGFVGHGFYRAAELPPGLTQLFSKDAVGAQRRSTTKLHIIRMCQRIRTRMRLIIRMCQVRMPRVPRLLHCRPFLQLHLALTAIAARRTPVA